ncbi:DUF2959 domain-containing protein [Allohahella marinimesophila]|uniref:DUF2959 domain-containing protein n=1 Tax=Allohahella marinimesophila TaxID=1054972 RepID=A0ABP7PLS9_9GAMM
MPTAPHGALPPMRLPTTRSPLGRAILLAAGLTVGTATLMTLQGCQSAYYSAMEKIGIPKREILKDRVENVKDSQEEAKEEFSSALEQFQALLGKQDSELQAKYDKLNDAFQDSEQAAEDVHDRIHKVEGVAEALFDEWEDELDIYSDESLKRRSSQKLKETRKEYQALLKTMKKAESRMEPVLTIFRDQVLYLKHNLNAQAIDGLKSELGRVESQVEVLIKEMNQSIAEATAFMATLETD